MVRLLLFPTTDKCPKNTTFNPTMVRLLHAINQLVRQKPYLPFNPTMVRLLLPSMVMVIRYEITFQSHNGAIAAGLHE